MRELAPNSMTYLQSASQQSKKVVISPNVKRYSVVRINGESMADEVPELSSLKSTTLPCNVEGGRPIRSSLKQTSRVDYCYYTTLTCDITIVPARLLLLYYSNM